MKCLYIKYLFLFFYIHLPTFTDEEPKWTTYIDDGRVGSASYANDTLRGQTRGAEIYKGQPKYVSYGPNGQIYYTYNPINGTYYRVENN